MGTSVWNLISMLIFVYICGQAIEAYEQFEFPLLMPNVQPTKKDTYFCTAFKLPHDEHNYIVEFTPKASKNTAHHILVYGCETPGHYKRDVPRGVWDCGEMAETVTDFPRAPTCARGATIIYAWAMDAPKLVLPQGVGFKVGGHSGINFIVLQVHYAHVDHFLNGGTDNSGIVLTMQPQSATSVTKRAGVLLLGTAGKINRHSVEHMETECPIREPLTLHPFAFRTHTHKLGTAVSGWKVDTNGNWQLIGRHNPQQPQMFYPVEESLVISQGDIVAARCTMNNTQQHDVYIGSTGDDEMCNFYMMYYVDGDRTLDQKYCFSAGAPRYHWDIDPNLGDIPNQVDIEASKPE